MSVNPTQITINPPAPAKELGAPIFGVRTPGDSDSFGAGVSDLIDIVNPLHHIPFVSHLYEAATGDKASPIAQMVGGALVGGPIGFLLALGNVIFEQQTGHGMAGAAFASLTGADAAKSTQVASAASAYAKTAAVTAPSPSAVHANAVQILPPERSTAITNDKYSQLAQDTQMRMASAISDVGPGDSAMDFNQRKQDENVLSLFGGGAASAHKSYNQAQMLPYLDDVSTSLVM